MTAKKLAISPDLDLPLRAVTEKIGFLGRTGQGKSYAALKLAELMHDAGAQFVGLDPVGVWWGLRLAADGKKPGLNIPVFGGLHGDMPLEPGAGRLVADLVVESGTSIVLDVSQFESDAAKARFAADFADRFFFRKKSAPSAVHVFLEECQEFVPQNPEACETTMLNRFTRMVKIGRNFGIGVSMISQRPQEVNKKALNQTELLFCFQFTGKHERKAVAGWIAEKGIEEDIAAELPKLKQGRPHVWSPSWLEISKVLPVGERWTFDASATPEVGKSAKARELSPIDLEQFKTAMAATIEKAKAEDPKLLKAKVAQLERDFAAAQKTKAPAAKADPGAIAKAVERERARFERSQGKLAAEFNARGARVLGAIQNLEAVARKCFAGVELPKLPPAPSPVRTHTNLSEPVRIHAPRPRREPVEASGNGQLAKGERKVLVAIAQQAGAGATREQLTVLTAYKRSSRDTYLQRLQAAGYVAPGGAELVATEEGLAALGDFEQLPVGSALLAHHLAELPEGERRVLEAVVAAYPEAIERAALDETTGYKRSSRDTYLQRLGARRLVENAGRGAVRASPMLFD